MAEKAGPARAAGRLAPPGTIEGITFSPRRVRIETRTGKVTTKKDAPTPHVEIELGAGERLLDFVIGADGGPGLLAPIEKRLAWEKRKTLDWEWEATVEVPVLPKPRRRAAASSSSKGGSR